MGTRSKPRVRIKAHRNVRVGDILPHPLNPRLHSSQQQATLEASLRQVGFARSVTVYELPDGRLQALDGHLRLETLDPDFLVPCEVLDVTALEGNQLLATLDPLAGMALYDQEIAEKLISQVSTEEEDLQKLWDALLAQDDPLETVVPDNGLDAQEEAVPPSYLIIVTCKDEEQQKQLIARFTRQGLSFTAPSAG